MDCINSKPSVQCLTNFSAPSVIDQSRRTANYKPNIWKYDLLEALSTDQYTDKEYIIRFNELVEEVKGMFFDTTAETLAKLELIDNIQRLGLAYLFEHEIVKALDLIASNRNPGIEKDLYATALLFTLLRQHGYQVSQDMFIGFMDSSHELVEIGESDVKAMLKLFEASHLALENENILDEVKEIARQNLNIFSSKLDDNSLAKTASHTLQLPYRLEWYNVKRQISSYEKDSNTNCVLLNLAKLNFNMVQATHQKELKEISRWWRNLGIAESFTFTRNRIVESYLWAVGVAFEPRNGSFRKWLAKAIKLVLVIDDVYDIYGTLQELEHFTGAVDSWDAERTKNLPECMKICFQTLYDTTNEIAFEIQKEKGWDSVLPYLQEIWADFCKALLVEAKWYNKSYTPSLQEYLDNGWISSCGPILSLHSLFFATHGVAEEAVELLEITHDIVYNASLIIRLCNDLGTSAAELERGDAPSSILCLMRERNVSEEVARVHIRSLITNSWKKINYECLTLPPLLQPFVKCIKNIARVVQFIYQNGDGFGVPDRETRDQVSSLLIEPLTLN